MALQTDDAIAEVYKTIRNDKQETNWAVFGIEGNKLVLQGSGSGGISEMLGSFQPDQVQYAYTRVISGDSESKRAKFVFISWCGEKVGALKRAKVSVQKAEVKKTIRDFAVEVHGETLDELSEETIMTKVRKAGGADYSGNLYQ